MRVIWLAPRSCKQKPDDSLFFYLLRSILGAFYRAGNIGSFRKGHNGRQFNRGFTRHRILENWIGAQQALNSTNKKSDRSEFRVATIQSMG